MFRLSIFLVSQIPRQHGEGSFEKGLDKDSH